VFRKTFPCWMIALILLSLNSHATVAQGVPSGKTAKLAFCHECISIRVGLPRVARGPAADIADNTFSELQLPNGRFRGFDAHGDTRAIDGAQPWDMGGPARMVMTPGKPGSNDSCGQWIQHVELTGNTVLAFVHDETACRYQAGQTHKSMSLAVSKDYGLTWKDLGQVITGTDAPTANKNTGEGDCTFVNGHDGYYYAYCGRPRDHAAIALRAPVSNPGPGRWMKFYQGEWSQPGLGGDATNLNLTLSKGQSLNTSAAYWTTTGETILTGNQDSSNKGVYFSSDHKTFTDLKEPLLVLDPGIWKRPDPSEVVGYAVILDAKTGSNQLSNSWMLTYAYWPPYEGSDKKLLVFRDVDVTLSDKPVTPQVGVLLARWYNSALHDRWSTTAAAPPVNGSAYKLETTLGYVMTVAKAGGKPSVKVEDCVSPWPGHPDHMLETAGACEAGHYQRLRTAGWVYSSPQENSIPLYRCYNDQDHSHFASNQQDCEKIGKMERLLGYALKQ